MLVLLIALKKRIISLTLKDWFNSEGECVDFKAVSSLMAKTSVCV